MSFGAIPPGFTQQEADVVRVIILASSGLSVAGTLSIMIIHTFFVAFRASNLRVVFWLAAAHFLSAVAYMASQIPTGEGEWCDAQAFAVQWATVSTFLWNAAVAVHAFASVMGGRAERDLRTFERWYHAACWILPLGFAVALLLKGRIGRPFIGCSVYELEDWWRFSLFYVPLLAAVAWDTVVYFLVLRSLRTNVVGGSVGGSARAADHEQAEYRSAQLQFSLFILAFLVCWAPAIISNVWEFFLPSTRPVWILYAQWGASCLHGFVDALVFGYNRAVRDSLRVCCSGLKRNRSRSRAATVHKFQPLLLEKPYNVNPEEGVVTDNSDTPAGNRNSVGAP